MPTNAESKPVTTWQRQRQARDARLEAGARLAHGKIVEARDVTRLMEAVIGPGDRVCLEGDNQKQADLLSSALLAVDLAKVHDLHMAAPRGAYFRRVARAPKQPADFRAFTGSDCRP